MVDDLSILDPEHVEAKPLVGFVLVFWARDLLLDDKRDHVPLGNDIGWRTFHFRADIVDSGLRKSLDESGQRGPISSGFAAFDGRVMLDEIRRVYCSGRSILRGSKTTR